MFVSLVGVAASLTVLWLGMRSVMDIGGSCASGGPFVPRVDCPSGVPILIVGSIWFGLGFAAVYFWQTFRHGAPSLGALIWPALFLSLGYNFLVYGLNPPLGTTGVEVGWLVCAVVFAAMGGFPLLVALPAVWRSFHGQGMVARARELVFARKADPTEPTTPWGVGGWFGTSTTAGSPTSSAPGSRGVRTGVASETPPRISVVALGPAGGMPDDVVSALERLDQLHRSGALTDAQYEDAKDRVIEAGP